VPVPDILLKKGMEKLALTGGEDYQLLFTFPPKKLVHIEALKKKGHMVSVIGEVTKGKGVKLFQKGKEMKLTAKGYQHFKEKPHG
jgi:thiamine-monophosphate kinase